MIVCLDANIVIYLVEANPTWTRKATDRLTVLRTAGYKVAVCDAARVECLTKPLALGNAIVAATYRSFFSSPAIQMLPVTAAVWERAAEIGATFNFKPLDAVHLAAAIEHGCGIFLTNDNKLSRCTGISVEILV